MELPVKSRDTEAEHRREKIIALLTSVLDRYEAEEGVVIKRDQYREHYKGVAKKLSEISVRLPEREPMLFSPKPEDPAFYSIKEGQVESAFNKKVQKLKAHIAAACFLYLNPGASAKEFEKQIQELAKTDSFDVSLLLDENEDFRQQLLHLTEENNRLKQTNERLQQKIDTLAEDARTLLRATQNTKQSFLIGAVVLFIVAGVSFFWYRSSWKNEAASWTAANQTLQRQFDSSRIAWNTIQEDFRILPYKPTPEQLALFTGNYMAYAPSPQARTSIPASERLGKVVSNFVHFTPKNGYLVFERYGPGFNQKGVLQFESSSVVSLRAFTINPLKGDTMESPKQSLWTIENGKPHPVVLSTTWNFDPGHKNIPIASREVYEKLGTGGSPVPEDRTKETNGCRCTYVHWKKDGKEVTDTVRIQSLTSLPMRYRSLLNEQSILLRLPNEVEIPTPKNDVKKN
jgi:hypothetical protein